MSATLQDRDLDTTYTITPDHAAQFRRDGFIKLKNVLSPETLDYYGKEITRQVIRLNKQTKPMEERTTYEKAFLQIGNIWLQSEIAKEFVFSKKLGRIAAELMGVRGVRLYHDQALYKEASGGSDALARRPVLLAVEQHEYLHGLGAIPVYARGDGTVVVRRRQPPLRVRPRLADQRRE